MTVAGQPFISAVEAVQKIKAKLSIYGAMKNRPLKTALNRFYYLWEWSEDLPNSEVDFSKVVFAQPR
jgi:hypothetical protein